MEKEKKQTAEKAVKETKTQTTQELLPMILYGLQQGVQVGKDETNQYGGYKYRNVEQIMRVAKKHLANTGACIVMNDKIVEIGGRLFLQAEVALVLGASKMSTTAYAELGQHKGMSSEQMTGCASSYARKYALCGLLGIDDAKQDPDAMDNRGGDVFAKIEACTTREQLVALWKSLPQSVKSEDVSEAFHVKSENVNG